MIKVIPMIFNTEMVKAILDGRKTVTRRPAKTSYERGMNGPVIRGKDGTVSVLSFAPVAGLCPFGNVGDLIYVRETWRSFNASDECGCSEYPCNCPQDGTPLYFASHDDGESKWKPSIHMPRHVSRLTLKVTGVGIQRVRDITEEQAKVEGVAPAFIDQFDNCPVKPTYKNGFVKIWDSIYGNWEKNPYVWVVQFEVVHKNVDKLIGELKQKEDAA
ncbi:hypothetical protein [Vibrio parahaemolyticus]|uniref:hypothetical protein n=1 Tax=Vibrio parahaemolyticus TaxID=670 RepID=UPI00069DD057|nr:hypothetical protein [Vibrio parahaemolyticus]EII3125380.1 hypothetical protein [Vibrio parahaemolyticus]